MVLRRALLKKKLKKKINKSKFTALRLLKKHKLKKKWRFWRTFKFYFLKDKTLRFFTKIKWFFNQKRIIWRHLATMYGKKIKSLVFNNVSKKIVFDGPFFLTLAFFELRLNILIVRMGFATKLFIANELIRKGDILINNKKKSIHYLTRIKDVVQKQKQSNLHDGKHKRIKRHNWGFYYWRKWKKKQDTKIRMFLRRQVLYLNFIEINYRISSGIVLRKPLLGEVLLVSQKKILSTTMLKKLYYLY